MLRFLSENWGTILVCMMVLLAVVLCVRSLIREKSSGGCSCGGNCAGCSGCGGVQPKK